MPWRQFIQKNKFEESFKDVKNIKSTYEECIRSNKQTGFFKWLLSRVLNLGSEEVPDYESYINGMEQELVNNGERCDWVMDWTRNTSNWVASFLENK